MHEAFSSFFTDVECMGGGGSYLVANTAEGVVQ